MRGCALTLLLATAGRFWVKNRCCASIVAAAAASFGAAAALVEIGYRSWAKEKRLFRNACALCLGIRHRSALRQSRSAVGVCCAATGRSCSSRVRYSAVSHSATPLGPLRTLLLRWTCMTLGPNSSPGLREPGARRQSSTFATRVPPTRAPSAPLAKARVQHAAAVGLKAPARPALRRAWIDGAPGQPATAQCEEAAQRALLGVPHRPRVRSCRVATIARAVHLRLYYSPECPRGRAAGGRRWPTTV